MTKLRADILISSCQIHLLPIKIAAFITTMATMTLAVSFHDVSVDRVTQKKHVGDIQSTEGMQQGQNTH